MSHLPKIKPVPTVRDLYPGHTDEWYEEAEENLKEYVALAMRIFQRIRQDPEAYAKFKKEIAETKRMREELCARKAQS